VVNNYKIMSDLLDEFNKVLKKDLVPFVVQYFKDPSNIMSENLNEIFEKFSRNKDIDNQRNNIDFENLADVELDSDDEYDELLKRLILIQENMIQIKKILKDKN
tara:strand:+ start:361 stop:672 length:312 start_codon:yes stop_codon:yes gene_type:complete